MSTEKTIEERLKELEGLAAKASPGPWQVDDDGDVVDDDGGGMVIDKEMRSEDVAFIAAAREAVPWLITELRKAQQELTAWREDSDNARYCEKCGRLHGPAPRQALGYNKRGGICDG